MKIVDRRLPELELVDQDIAVFEVVHRRGSADVDVKVIVDRARRGR